jgi:hypothetical protein
MSRTSAKRPSADDRQIAARTQALPDDPLAGKLVVRPKEAWAIIGCGHSTGWKLVKEGRLKVTKVGAMTLIHAHSIRELLGIPPTGAEA